MGRNLVKLKNMTLNRHFDVPTKKEVESLHCFFVFEWINLKFGARGNFRLLTLNINSRTQYKFEILG